MFPASQKSTSHCMRFAAKGKDTSDFLHMIKSSVQENSLINKRKKTNEILKEYVRKNDINFCISKNETNPLTCNPFKVPFLSVSKPADRVRFDLRQKESLSPKGFHFCQLKRKLPAKLWWQNS